MVKQALSSVVEEGVDSPTPMETDNGEHNTENHIDDINDENAYPPPRLIITKMELENFKSYAGIRDIGPFHKCFSAVVGPNGSGKSNVIDAMLFVFGKRAKKLRLNKVSELIHKSEAVSDNPPTFARVSVYFQDIIDTGPGDYDYKLVPGTEMVVSRIARDDNSSTYKIGNKNCQFKDVAKFLDSKGIDLDNNRFLILQGEVEMISMMPPKGKNEGDEGLLEYLEEIIGSNKYVEDTNLAAEQVEALSDVRQEKLNRVKAVEKEKEALEAAKQEAEALLAKEREIRRKQNILYQINAMKIKKENVRCIEEKDGVCEKLTEERELLNTNELRVKELEKGLKTQQREYMKSHNELVKTKEEFASYERRDIKLREEIKHAKGQQKKLEEKIKQETKKRHDSIQKGKLAEDSIPELEEKITDLLECKTREEEKLDQLYEKKKIETQSIRVELEAKTVELAPIQQERASFQANLDTAVTQVQLLEDTTKRNKERLLEAEKELSSLDETKNAKRADLEMAQNELVQCENRIAEAENEELILSEKEEKLSKYSKKLLEQAEEAKASLQSKGGAKNPAIEGILRATRNGGQLSKAGVLGRLGDLATVEAEYDVAVSTACGMLDHIVVQTTAGAQRCLEFLREHNLGRANFIPLDKMKKGAHDSTVQTPEGAPRLFELISPVNFAITPAIYLAVGNTLVAPDLETASRWAYESGKRWRVVTVDGKLIETAGTMTGGGNNARKGGMRLANSRAPTVSSEKYDSDDFDCKKIEAEAEKAKSLLQECRVNKKILSDELKVLRKALKALEGKIPKLKIEIDAFDSNKADLIKFIPQLRMQCELSKDDALKLVDLKKDVQRCEADMSKCARLASELEKEVALLQKAILEAGEVEMKKQQTKCEKITLDLNSTEKALATAKVTIKTNQKSTEKASACISSGTEELEKCCEILEGKNSDLLALESDAIAVKESFKIVKEIEEEKRLALEEASKELDALKKTEADVRCKEIELLGKLDALEKQIQDHERKLKKCEADLEALRNKALDDEYDLVDDDGIDAVMEDAGSIDDPSNIQVTSEGDDDSAENSRTKKVHSSLPVLSFTVLEKYDSNDIIQDIGMLESERNTIAKNANMGAIAEYRKKEADYHARVEELDEVTEQRNEARKKHEDLRRLRLEMFMNGFGIITLKLKEMYQMITLGGDAELELVDSLDPFSEGIVFSVRPPKKSWKNISNLSGGEKTLSSLALVFALHHFKPTPLYVMDEIDAALDFKNVSIVANYIKERTRNAQFIIISLRNNMFELADRLVGIYKTNNCTKSVTIDPKAFGTRTQTTSNIMPATPALAKRTILETRSAMKSFAAIESANRGNSKGVSFLSEAE